MRKRGRPKGSKNKVKTQSNKTFLMDEILMPRTNVLKALNDTSAFMKFLIKTHKLSMHEVKNIFKVIAEL